MSPTARSRVPQPSNQHHARLCPTITLKISMNAHLSPLLPSSKLDRQSTTFKRASLPPSECNRLSVTSAIFERARTPILGHHRPQSSPTAHPTHPPLFNEGNPHLLPLPAFDEPRPLVQSSSPPSNESDNLCRCQRYNDTTTTTHHHHLPRLPPPL